MQKINENTLKTTARIMGKQSAAALALADADKRRANGEIIEFFRVGDRIIVKGTKPSTEI